MLNRKQKVKVKDVYNSWKEIFYGVPQGSILDPLLFNIYLCDLFYFLEDLDIASCANDTTIYIVNKQTKTKTKKNKKWMLVGWFNNNFMKANSDKSHLTMSCTEATTAMIDGLLVDSNKTEVFLRITINHELKFDDHVNYLCKKSSQKRNALTRIAPFMNVSENGLS